MNRMSLDELQELLDKTQDALCEDPLFQEYSETHLEYYPEATENEIIRIFKAEIAQDIILLKKQEQERKKREKQAKNRHVFKQK